MIFSQALLGKTSTQTIKVQDEHLIGFAKISGDWNPIHVDEEYASKSLFGRRIAHGMWLGSLFSALISSELPGVGSIYTSQQLKFIKPVYIGDEITVEIEITKRKAAIKLVELSCKITNQDGQLVCKGVAGVIVPE